MMMIIISRFGFLLSLNLRYSRRKEGVFFLFLFSVVCEVQVLEKLSRGRWTD